MACSLHDGVSRTSGEEYGRGPPLFFFGRGLVDGQGIVVVEAIIDCTQGTWVGGF